MVKADALRDPDVPGSLAATEKQVKLLEQELALLEEEEKNPEKAAEVKKEAIQKAKQGVELWIEKLDEVDNQLKEFMDPTSAAYAQVRNSAQLLNNLTTRRAELADMKQGLTAVRSALDGITGGNANSTVVLTLGVAYAVASSGSLISASALVAASISEQVFGKENFDSFVAGSEKAYKEIEKFSRAVENLSVENAVQLVSDWVGQDSAFSKTVGFLSDLANKQLNDTVFWINEASKLIQFTTTFLLAACKLLEAFKQYYNNLLHLMANLDALLATLVLNLIPQQLVFQLPKPVAYLLRAVDGLNSRLAGFSAVGKCFSKLIGNQPSPDSTEAPFSYEQTFNSVMGEISKEISKFVAGGLLALLNANAEEAATENPMAVVRNRWAALTGINKLAPTPPVVLPEEGAILAVLNAGVSLVGHVQSILKNFSGVGVGSTQPADLYQSALGPDGKKLPVVPSAANSIQNQIRTIKDQLALARAAAARASEAQRLANKMMDYSKKKASKEELASELTRQISISALSTNMLRNSNLDDLTPAAADYFACQAKNRTKPDQADGTPGGLVQPTKEELMGEFQDLTQACAVIAYSPAALLKDWHDDFKKSGDKLTAALVHDELAERVLRKDMTAEHKLAIKAVLEDKQNNQLEQLPIMLLLNSKQELEQWNRFFRVYEELLLEQTGRYPSGYSKLDAHLNLKGKAVAQGLQGSPYVFIANGLEALAIKDAKGNPVIGQNIDLYQALQAFLRHDYTFNLVPFDNWSRSGSEVARSIRRPENLTPDENKAAEHSFYFWAAYSDVLKEFGSLVIRLRTRADELGGPAGYELFAMLSALLVLKKIGFAEDANQPESATKALAAQGQKLLKHVSHPSSLDEAFSILAE